MNEPKQIDSTAIPMNGGVTTEIERLIASAQDALTDDMVTRLSSTITEGLDLLDSINRSGIAKALPAIVQLVENGDMERLVNLARFFAAVEDSLSDDIINRLSIVATEMASLVDKLSRNNGFMRLVDILGREEVQCGLVDVAESVYTVKKQSADLPAAKGGFGGLLKLAMDPGTQDALRFLSMVSKQLRQN